MSLQSAVQQVRKDCLNVLSTRRLSQQEFAERYELSYSWLNKFLNEKDTDSRVGSIERLRLAVQKAARELR
jgi:transcriptional regulator with XRE-family HTH domain